MKFRTEYHPVKSSIILSPEKPIVLAGSCFSQNMAVKMDECSWKAINPFGTLYNPFSIAWAIRAMQEGEKGQLRFENSLFDFNNLWNSRMFDSSFSSSVKEDCIQEFLLRQKKFIENLLNGKTIIVTFGTAIVYYFKESGIVVGNCHKQPADLYYEKRLTPNEIATLWNDLISQLKKVLPEIKIIFTLSPVRHLKNGFIGNARSKAVLHLAIEEICSNFDCCDYFPAYEILNDDLRDYRFYASDLVHPSKDGIDYIWEKFCETYLDEKGLDLIKEGEKKFRAANHIPKTGALGKYL